jgi:hypothetical protein
VLESRGSIVATEPASPGDAQLANAAGGMTRAVYASVTGYSGASSEVSGAFFIPKGDPPHGGWPVVSFAHGTTGLTRDCGPSDKPELMGYASTVAGLLTLGYAVAFTDYQGLGGPGAHPYLEPQTAAYNVIDAVRALHRLYPTTSPRWLAIGGSQGGQAAWAANELSDQYGAGLQLVGSVAIAPAVNLSELSDLAYSGLLTGEQRGAYPLVIVGLERTVPNFNTNAYLHGFAAAEKDSIIGCGDRANELRSQITNDELRPASAEDAAALRVALLHRALPQRPLRAPQLVINGLQDKSVLPVWVSDAVKRSCALGGQLQHVEVPDAGHSDTGDADVIEQWIADRFAGKPPANTCQPGS